MNLPGIVWLFSSQHRSVRTQRVAESLSWHSANLSSHPQSSPFSVCGVLWSAMPIIGDQPIRNFRNRPNNKLQNSSFTPVLPTAIFSFFTPTLFSSTLSVKSAGWLGQFSFGFQRNSGPHFQRSSFSVSKAWIPLDALSAGFSSDLTWRHWLGVDSCLMAATGFATNVTNLLVSFPMYFNTLKESVHYTILSILSHSRSFLTMILFTCVANVAEVNSSFGTVTAFLRGFIRDLLVTKLTWISPLSFAKRKYDTVPQPCSCDAFAKWCSSTSLIRPNFLGLRHLGIS